MPQTMQSLIEQYIAKIKKIYGTHLRKVILFGSYARGDFRRIHVEIQDSSNRRFMKLCRKTNNYK